MTVDVLSLPLVPAVRGRGRDVVEITRSGAGGVPGGAPDRVGKAASRRAGNGTRTGVGAGSPGPRTEII
ncbi:hypothetical protein [Streptomyces sp. NPDC058989]|uniref:hypothetical protein n=1 Tax=Streptomyces sp. NPDC058989 TaxID=3346686 RepID=UPI003684D95F